MSQQMIKWSPFQGWVCKLAAPEEASITSKVFPRSNISHPPGSHFDNETIAFLSSDQSFTAIKTDGCMAIGQPNIENQFNGDGFLAQIAEQSINHFFFCCWSSSYFLKLDSSFCFSETETTLQEMFQLLNKRNVNERNAKPCCPWDNTIHKEEYENTQI